LNLILGGLLGLLLGISIVLLEYFLQTSEKHPKSYPLVAANLEDTSEYSSSIKQLSRDMMTIHEQFEATRHELDQIRTALRKTNSYTKDIRSAVYDLEEHLEGNHSEVEKVSLGQDGS
jgi:chromosome segregation ATPase